MSRALVISDQPHIAFALENEFSNAGWSCNSISMNSMLGKASASASYYQCLILFLDTAFKQRFGSVIQEMNAIIRNSSRQASLYIIFEDDYDPCFSSWLAHSKKTFKQTSHHQGIWQAIKEIILLESGEVQRSAFISPMDTA
jgi:hypothetical protein